MRYIQNSDNETEFVITLPTDADYKLTYDSSARTTLGALVQILAQAKESIIISAPFFQIGELLNKDAIRIALEAAFERDVLIHLATSNEGIREIKNTKLLMDNVSHIFLYQSTENLENEYKIGSHAKFYVSDSKLAYLGSANFTTYGFDTHIEMGVLVKGRIVRKIVSFWEMLLNNGYYSEIKT